MFIKIGELRDERIEGYLTTYCSAIVKETEKAIQVETVRRRQRPSGKVRESTFSDWLPKSQIERIGDYIVIPGWLADKKQVQDFDITCTLDGVALKEQTGLDLVKLTPAQWIELLEKGLARISWMD